MLNWCKPHWDLLRAAVADRGLDKLGAQNAREAHAELVGQLEGEQGNFDPLLGSWNRINLQMLENVGLRAIGRCPLCILVEDGRPELVDNWINGVTDGALAYAREHGLVPKPQ